MEARIISSPNLQIYCFDITESTAEVYIVAKQCIQERGSGIVTQRG